MTGVRRLAGDPRAVDGVVVVGMACFVFSAYLDSYAHVKVPGTVLLDAEHAGQVGLATSWFVVTAFLFFLFARGLRRRARRSTGGCSEALRWWPNAWTS